VKPDSIRLFYVFTPRQAAARNGHEMRFSSP